MAAWSSRLCLIADKSNCMLIGSCQKVVNKTMNVSAGGNRLTQVISVQYLGVCVVLDLADL